MPRNDVNGEEGLDRETGNKKYSRPLYEGGHPHDEERRDFDTDCCERCKKWLNDYDHRYFMEKYWYPQNPAWYRCPPWFWCKPENEEKTKNEREDSDEKRRKHGELEAYGYVYSLTGAAAIVAAGADVLFTNNGPLECIFHTPNSPQLSIMKSGVYQIYYGVNATAGTGATIALAVNAAVDSSTIIPIATAPSETSGKVLLSLKAGDFLSLRNNSPATPITLAAAPAIGAQLTLERIDEIEKCID